LDRGRNGLDVPGRPLNELNHLILVARQVGTHRAVRLDIDAVRTNQIAPHDLFGLLQ
jgi:hypothetical protein